MRLLRTAFVLAAAVSIRPALAQSNSLFIGDNVMTGNTWHAASDAGNGTSGSCTTTANAVQYYSAPFFTDLTDDTYSLGLYYPSFQAGFVYLYQDAFDPQDPCKGIVTFGYAPVADIHDIHLDANRQYVFVTSEDVLFGGGGWFQATIEGPSNCHLFLGSPSVPDGPFCFGDGSGADCPCGASGGPANGCPNSANVNGAQLLATGTASVSNDSLVLMGSGMPNSTALYFQGTVRVANGVPFGNGLRCVGGQVRRMKAKLNTSGSSSYPQAGDPPISLQGADAAGDVRFYQCWYRDALASTCTGYTVNVTNAVQVTWTP